MTGGTRRFYREPQPGDCIIATGFVAGQGIQLWYLGSVPSADPNWQAFAIRAAYNVQRPRYGEGGLGRAWWRFGWNGERVSRCKDLALLRQRYPDIEPWIVGQLNELGPDILSIELFIESL